MKIILKENTWLTRKYSDHGWGNGYVAIPKEHHLYGMHYNDIHYKYYIEINGGLTFSDRADALEWAEIPEHLKDCWIVGFDTAHSWDTLEMWDREAVKIETEKLKSQLEQLK